MSVFGRMFVFHCFLLSFLCHCLFASFPSSFVWLIPVRFLREIIIANYAVRDMGGSRNKQIQANKQVASGDRPGT